MKSLTIKDKDSKLIRLDPDAPFAWAQREFIKTVEQQFNAGKPIRIIVLKGRQVGISTVTEALLFLWCFMFPGSNTLVMSKDRESSENLFEMTKLMWDMWDYRAAFSTTRSSVRRLSWAETLSNFRVESAKGTEVGRGTTLQGVHGSEVAFWPNAEELMPALMNAIPNRHGTIIVLESTAHGVGGFFYDEWMKSIRGESEFIPLFFPWFLHFEYTIRSTSLTEKQLTTTEKELREKFSLSMGQLAWRRRKIREHNGDEDRFREEFPCTWMEAFLSTGNNVFPLEALSECYFPVGEEWRGKKVGMSRGNLVNANGKLTFYKDYSGILQVYKKPGKGLEYVVAADPSRTDYGDPACIQVLNRITLEQVAVWRGHLIGGDLAELIYNLGVWYNTAIINVEFQGGGASVLGVLIHMRYPNIWKWRRPDRPLNRLGNVYGWVTNQMTKPWGIVELQHHLNKRAMTIHDSQTYLEMMQYTALDGVEMGPADAKGNDDTVMALMIALMTTLTSDPPDLATAYHIDMSPVSVGQGGYSESEYREID